MLIEKTIRDYLLEKIANVPIEVEEPTDKDKYVVFRVVERGKDDLINEVTVEFFSYGKSKLEAAMLDEEVRTAMENMAELDSIFSSKLGGGNDSYNTDLKKYRYRSYFNIYY